MQESGKFDITRVLKQFQNAMSEDEFKKRFEVEIPTMFANFVMTSMTQHIQEINVDSPQINFLLFYPYMIEQIQSCAGSSDEEIIREIFFSYSQSLVNFWTKSLKEIIAAVDGFKQINLNSVYLNRMVVLYLIQQLSGDCEKRIRKNMKGTKFEKIQESNKFIKFIIERLEVFQWRPITEEDWKQFDKILCKRYTAETAQNQIQFIFGKAYEDLKSTPCQQSETVKGILISDPDQPQKGQYMLYTRKDSLLIINAKYLVGWSKFQFECKHKRIELQLKESFQSPQSSFITNALTNIGSSLGYLLANMPDRPSKFLQQFFLACTISGSMTVILINIPILGKLILLGGLGYQAADVLQNADIQTKKKLQKIIGISLSMTVTVTTSIAGAIAGQILIPVPILGGFLGGVVGGLIGGLSTTAALNKFQKYKVKKMMETLQQRQNPDGSWEVETVLDTFDLKDSFFTKYESTTKLKDLVTLFTYFILALFESQRQHQQIAELQEKCKKKWYKTPTQDDIKEAKEQIDIKVMDVPEVLLHSEVYFMVHDIKVVKNFSLLERMTQQLLGIL